MTPKQRPFTAGEAAIYDAALADLLRDEARWREIRTIEQQNRFAVENARLRAALESRPPNWTRLSGLLFLLASVLLFLFSFWGFTNGLRTDRTSTAPCEVRDPGGSGPAGAFSGDQAK